MRTKGTKIRSRGTDSPLTNPFLSLAVLDTNDAKHRPYCAQIRSKVAAGASAPSALRCPKKSSRCSLARFFRPLRVLRLAASATGGARLRTPYPLPRCGEGGLYQQSLHKNAPAAPYKRRRVGRNLRLSRADPALCSGQPSPLRCILLSPQGLTTLRGPRLYGVYRRVTGL